MHSRRTFVEGPRRRVLDGELSPEALCELSPDELATDEMKRGEDGRAVVQAAHEDHRHPHGHDEMPLQDCDSNECAYADLKGHRTYARTRRGFERKRGRCEGDGGVQTMRRGVERDGAVGFRPYALFRHIGLISRNIHNLAVHIS